MRKESRLIMTAFIDGKPARAARTRTNGKTVWLHGNAIAWRDSDGTIWATLAGWPTVTTRERLNALCDLLGVRRGFGQRDYRQYYDGSEIGSRETVMIK